MRLPSRPSEWGFEEKPDRNADGICPNSIPTSHCVTREWGPPCGYDATIAGKSPNRRRIPFHALRSPVRSRDWTPTALSVIHTGVAPVDSPDANDLGPQWTFHHSVCRAHSQRQDIP
ncbi:hypothetical protein GCM10010483_46340 [Actinokineospora diospyrosa]